MITSYVAIGDSFTEGVGDVRDDGSLRGWADRVAEGLAEYSQSLDPTVTFKYANLAIRGRRLGPLLDEQLENAISMRPDLISLNGGGNDILRPNFSLSEASTMVRQAIEKIRRANISVLLLSGPDPSNHLPMGKLFHRRGQQFTDLTGGWAEYMGGVYYRDNFSDPELWDEKYWSEDGLHLCPAGHMKVAENCLNSMNIPIPSSWKIEDWFDDQPRNYLSKDYYKEFVRPWIGRRLTGRSSGDGRSAKRPELSSFL